MTTGDKLPSIRNFDAWASHLRQVYFKAKRRREVRPRDNAVNALKDALYGYFQTLKEADLLGELERHIRENHEAWKGPRPNDAAWVVRLIESGKEFVLDDSARNRMVADLTLADLNGIDPAFLLAFIYEAGPIAERKRALAKSEVFAWASRYRED